MIQLPDVDDEDGASTETIPAVAQGPEFPAEPALPATSGSRSRTVKTPFGPYQLPPLDLFRTAPPSNADARAEKDTLAALERTLHTFGVDARVVGAHRGPTVTMYEVAVASGTKVQKVVGLSSDISYALASPDVRIQAPIPGKSAIGIEVPNTHRDFVMVGDVLRSPAAKQATHPLEVALGKDVHGRARMVNLADMPHLLIAGATGAGKSSLVNSFITSLLARTTPEDVRLVLIDPKRVELSHFGDVPHLLSPVIVHPKRAAEALQWIVREMEMRYELLATVAVRDIDSYEEGLRDGTLRIPPGMEEKFEHMPFIVVVIDELADLMMVAPRAVEDAICRIAQMARAVGIHLVVATQRPSVDVVTGLDQGEHPVADRADDLVAGGLARDPRHERRREARGPRRHAVRAVEHLQARSDPGRVGDGSRGARDLRVHPRTTRGRLREHRGRAWRSRPARAPTNTASGTTTTCSSRPPSS